MHPALPANLPRRLFQLLAGLTACGTGLAMMVLAGLGLGPWDVLAQGLAARTGLGMGTVIMAVGAMVLLAWIPLRERPGIGTVLNVITIGVVVNAWLTFAEPPSSNAVRVAMVVAGTPLFALGVGLYIGAGLGTGPRDGVMTGLAKRGVPIWLARSGIELVALIGGWALGGTVGLGTVLFVATIGPLVHVTVPRFRLDPTGPEMLLDGPGEAALLLEPVAD